MKTKLSTNFWIVFALWIFTNLFMCFIELIAIFEVKSEQIAFLKYVFLTSSFSGTLLLIFNSLYLFKDKKYFKKMAVLFLVIYLSAQIAMLVYCFYKEIPNLGNAVIIRIIFILFQVGISFHILKKRDSEAELGN